MLQYLIIILFSRLLQPTSSLVTERASSKRKYLIVHLACLDVSSFISFIQLFSETLSSNLGFSIIDNYSSEIQLSAKIPRTAPFS